MWELAGVVLHWTIFAVGCLTIGLFVLAMLSDL